MLNRIKERLRQSKNTHNTIKVLESMSDRDLRDIGLTRGDIPHVVRSILNTHRVVRDSDDK